MDDLTRICNGSKDLRQVQLADPGHEFGRVSSILVRVVNFQKKHCRFYGQFREGDDPKTGFWAIDEGARAIREYRRDTNGTSLWDLHTLLRLTKPGECVRVRLCGHKEIHGVVLM